jgi:hypothetical protein
VQIDSHREARFGSKATEWRCPCYVRSPLNFRHNVAPSRTSKWATSGLMLQQILRDQNKNNLQFGNTRQPDRRERFECL